MTTLKDTRAAIVAVSIHISLGENMDAAKKEFGRLRDELGSAIIAERGDTEPSEAQALPEDTVLGTEAEAKFQRLKDWMEENEVFVRG